MTYGMGGWIVCNFRVAGNGHMMNFLWDIIHLWNCMELLKPLLLLNVTYIVGELLEGQIALT
jgi:hypothetical protein